MNLFTEQKQTHRLREQPYGYQGGRMGEGKIGSLVLTCTPCYIENKMPLHAKKSGKRAKFEHDRQI